MLFGAGLVGLRSLSGRTHSASVLLESASRDRPQGPMAGRPMRSGGGHQSAVRHLQHVVHRLIPSTAARPGRADDPKIYHAGDPSMASTPMTFGSRGRSTGPRSGRRSGPAIRRRAIAFFHHGTYTIIHPDEVKVLGLLGRSRQRRDALLVPRGSSRRRSEPGDRSRSRWGGNGAGEAIFYQGQPQSLPHADDAGERRSRRRRTASARR